MCPRTCCCPQCLPYHPSDGNKGPPRQPLSPHRPLFRSRREESPRHTPGTRCPSSRVAAAALPAFAASGQLLTGLAADGAALSGLPDSFSHPNFAAAAPALAGALGAQCGGARREARRDGGGRKPHNCSSAFALCCSLWTVLGSGRASSETLKPEKANLGILSLQSALRY